MKGVVWRLVSLALAGMMLIGLVAGCGEGKEPIATSAPATPEPTASAAPGEAAEMDRKIEEYSKAIALDPQDAVAYYNRGIAYYDKGDLDRAIADYDQAIALDPQDVAA